MLLFGVTITTLNIIQTENVWNQLFSCINISHVFCALFWLFSPFVISMPHLQSTLDSITLFYQIGLNTGKNNTHEKVCFPNENEGAKMQQSLETARGENSMKVIRH